MSVGSDIMRGWRVYSGADLSGVLHDVSKFPSTVLLVVHGYGGHLSRRPAHPNEKADVPLRKVARTCTRQRTRTVQSTEDQAGTSNSVTSGLCSNQKLDNSG